MKSTRIACCLFGVLLYACAPKEGDTTAALSGPLTVQFFNFNDFGVTADLLYTMDGTRMHDSAVAVTDGASIILPSMGVVGMTDPTLVLGTPTTVQVLGDGTNAVAVHYGMSPCGYGRFAFEGEAFPLVGTQCPPDPPPYDPDAGAADASAADASAADASTPPPDASPPTDAAAPSPDAPLPDAGTTIARVANVSSCSPSLPTQPDPAFAIYPINAPYSTSYDTGCVNGVCPIHASCPLPDPISARSGEAGPIVTPADVVIFAAEPSSSDDWEYDASKCVARGAAVPGGLEPSSAFVRNKFRGSALDAKTTPSIQTFATDIERMTTNYHARAFMPMTAFFRMLMLLGNDILGFRRIFNDIKDWSPACAPPLPPQPSDKLPAPEDAIKSALETRPVNGGIQGFNPKTIADYVAAYKAGKPTPRQVADYWIATVAKEQAALSSDDRTGHQVFIPLTAAQITAIRTAADAATAVWAKGGDPAKPLLGVPFAVKDQMDLAGFVTGLGTSWRTTVPMRDASVVANIKAMGGMFVAKTNMHEYGVGVTSVNPHWGAALNAYDTGRWAGGSSVATSALWGLPVVGSDAGGSVRIPAVISGVVGLKPTLGRLSNSGNYPLAFSLTQPGPIASNARDLAAMLVAMAGTSHGFSGFTGEADLKKFHPNGKPLVVGYHKKWNDEADADTRAEAARVLELLKDAGAEIVQIDDTINATARGIPHLGWSNMAQMLIFATNLSTIVRRELDGLNNGDAIRYGKISAEARIALEMGVISGPNGFTIPRLGGKPRGDAFDQLDLYVAMRIAQQLTRAMLNIFCDAGVDIILTPATGRVAQKINANAFPEGESNLAELQQVALYTALANLTGLPALSMTTGYNSDKLPMGVQFIGGPWQETTLLRVAHIMEGRIFDNDHKRQAPATTYDPLPP